MGDWNGDALHPSLLAPVAMFPSNPQSYSPHYAQAYLRAVPHPQPVYAQPTPPQSSTWYQSGPHRCTHKQCSFSGSKKAVEIHMMDRHLIYPPTYSKNRKQTDWDADPSLKGKPIPIQGTNVILNSPEDIEAWIADRRKRFPTAARVAKDKEKQQEAVARGQLHLDDNPRFPKRPRLDNDTHRNRGGRARGRGRGTSFRGRGSGSSSNPKSILPSSLPPRPLFFSETSSDSDDDGPPEAFSSKPMEPLSPHEFAIIPKQESSFITRPPEQQMSSNASPTKPRNPFPRQPKNLPSNPFASKPSLLRNLLLPEIRNTVSNLSQAIRFLVDNDFLENVELKPGDAERRRIQVVKSEDHNKGVQ